MTGNLQNVEIIKVGQWNASTGRVNVTSAVLDQLVANFATINQVAGYGVPGKIGHSNGVGAPAYGWMSALQRIGDVLIADFSDVPPEIVDAIAKRRYNSVSVEIYPKVQFDGKSFENVLGGVAFLGAEWPAVKGLKPLSASKFSEDEQKLELTLTEEPQVANEEIKFTQATADALVLAAETRLKAEHVTALSAETAKTLAEKTRADKAEGDLKKFRDDADKASVDALIAAAEKTGKIVPGNKEKITKLASSVMKLSAEDRGDAITTLAELINGAAPKVKFGEKGASKSDAGVEVGEKASDQLDIAARSLLSADKSGKMTYEGAVTAALAADPDLKRAYAQGA